jgi:phage repressor protein C with HTH and peptisase S24 domain
MMPRVWKPTPQLLERFDEPRRVLAELIATNEEDLARLSTQVCGKNASYLWQFFTRNKPRALPEDVRISLASHFGVDQNQLRLPSSRLVASPSRNGVNPPLTSGALVTNISSTRLPDKIPVLGRAIAGSAKIIWDNGRPQEWVDRPPYLNNPEAFAIYVNGESMQPRYFSGERVYIDPSRPLSRDCFVAVECKDDTAVVKQYVRHDDAKVELRQFNPAKTIHIPTDQIRAIHRIVGSSER